LHRPDLLSSLDLFILGLLADLVAAMPLGVTSLVLLTVRRMLLAPQRPALARSFVLSWLGFTLTVLAVQLLRWLVMLVLQASLFPLAPAMIEAVVTAALYPVVVVLLTVLAARLEKLDHATQG
jgi:cell shape-determining protein MreD